MEEFKIGDKVYVKTLTGKVEGEIIDIFSWKLNIYNKLDYEHKNNSYDKDDVAVIRLNDTTLMTRVLIKNITKIDCKKQNKEENIKDNLQFKVIGAKRGNDCKILWNRIDNLNLEFTVEGRTNVVTAIKVLIKNLDLEEFTYERVCPYKVLHEYPRNNEERNHIFIVKWVDFNGEIQAQEVLRTDDSLSLENCTCKVFIPDLLEIAKNRGIVRLEDNTYKAKVSKLKGTCNDFEPIIKVDRDMFEKQGWEVPKSFEKRFMNYKNF